MTASLAISASPARSAELRRTVSGRLRLVSAGDPREVPDCVLVVHEPPGMDALAQLAQLGGADGVPATPVIILASCADPTFRRTALQAGAMEVLEQEHVEAETLTAAVDDAIARFSVLRRKPATAHQDEPFAMRVVNGLFAFVGVLDPTGTLLDANQAPLAAADLRLEDVRGKKFWDCYWWTYADEVRQQVRRACEQAARGEIVRYDVDVRMAGDTRMTIDFQIAPLRDAAGVITHLVPSAVDITERARAEHELRRSEELVRTIAENSTQGFAMMDERGHCTYANRAWSEMTGFTLAELGAAPLHDLVHHHHLDGRPFPMGECPFDRALPENFDIRAHEDTFFRKDGRPFPVLCAASPIFKDGRPASTVIEIRDMTAAKQIEVALRASEQRAREAAARAEAESSILNAILDAAPAAIIVADATGKLLRFNAANELLWGPAPLPGTIDEYREWKGWWADPSARRGKRLEPQEWALARALRGEVARNDIVEIEPFEAPGSRRTMVNSAATVRDAEGRITGAIVAQMDISALVAERAARTESEARFRALADNIAQLAWMADETGELSWFNRRWFEFTGLAFADMEHGGWQQVHHPDHVGRVVEKFRRHLASGEPWEDTFPLRSARGDYRWFLSRAVPIRDDHGRVVRWFGTNTDVTEQREAEDALRQADRRKDEFIAILAHELRNPLAPVRLAVELLRMTGPAEPRLDRARDIIDRQVTHMARLIDDLLDVSRITRGKLALQTQTCDLAAIARQTADDYRASVEAAGVTLSVIDSVGPVRVEGDPVRLAQMIGNLLNNAARFTEPGGRVELRVERDVASRLALVSVADTGVGIDPALLSRLFDPFSQADQDLARTKGGLGLGLALTKGLAELHGGGVSVHSEGLGQGATFTVRLPLSKVRYAATSSSAAVHGATRRLRILVVEDNRDAAEVLGELLELRGHEVKLAFSGTTAVASARTFRPDVVISDIGLPGELDGYAVARILREDPALDGVHLIAISGYSNEEARRRSREVGFEAHLAKPPDLGTLEQLLSTFAAR